MPTPGSPGPAPGRPLQPSVARVITRLNVGGPSHHVRILCSRMTGFDSVLYAGRPEPREGSMVAEVREAGVTVVEIGALRRQVAPLADLRALYALYRAFRRRRPAVVATHMAKAGTLGRLAAIAARVPVRVHTFHGHVLEGYFGGAVSAAFRIVERWLARHTTAFIAISPEIAGDIERLLGVDPARIRVVRLGLDLEGLDQGHRERLRAELGIPQAAPVVGIVGRLAPVKNHRLFIEAARQVARSRPDVHFAIVGDGPERDRVETWVAEAGLGERVHLTGWRRDLADVYAAIDVVVCCSHNEGTPVSVIEAGAARRPAVCTDVGGMRDVVEDGRHGFLVAASAGAIAEAVERLLADPGLARRMGDAAHQSALERYGADRLVSEVSDIYRRLLEGRGTVGAGAPGTAA